MDVFLLVFFFFFLRYNIVSDKSVQFVALQQQEALCNFVPFCKCAYDVKNISPQNFSLKIDLWQHVAKDTSVQYITQGVFQLNGTMFWYSDCVLKGFLPPHCIPSPLTCSTLHMLFPETVISLSVTMSRFKCALANLFTSGKVAWGRIASGVKYTQLLFLSVSIMWGFKTALPRLHLLQIQLLHRFSSENIYEKGLNNIYVNWNRPCVVMMMCVIVWEITRQHWMVTVKWGCCVVCLWAIKCQLFGSVLSRGDLNDI